MSTPAPRPLAIVSHLYPMRSREHYGVFVAEQTRALVAAGADVRALVVPVPWAPWPLPALSASWRRYAAAERTRTDFGSVRIDFPRYPSFPRKLLRGLSATLACRSALRVDGLEQRIAGARVIVAHTALLDGRIARELSRRFGLPYVVFVHGEDLYQNVRGPAGARLAGAVGSVLSDAAAVIAVSEPVAEGLAQAFPSLPRARVLPNGVDTQLFAPRESSSASPTAEGPLRVLSAGHLVERKAHAYVLRAIATLVEAGADIRYSIAGDGPERGALTTLAAELGIAERVDFLGAYRHEELPALLHDADLFALPSWDEAFGVVYLEALACGVPALAATGEGAATIIDDGADGYLVAPRDADAVAVAIRRHLDTDAATRATMHAAAREKALRYTWDTNARGLLSIIDDITG